MADTVESFIFECFTDPEQQNSSVEEKAAEWLSIQKLKKAFKKLRNYQEAEENEPEVGRQIGL